MEQFKEFKDLAINDKLIRLSDERSYAISDILNDSEEEEGFSKFKSAKYFYFKELGSSVRDKVLRKMFKTKNDKFVIVG